MAGVTGLEPAASGVTGRRSNQLSYTPCGEDCGCVCSMDFVVSNPKNTLKITPPEKAIKKQAERPVSIVGNHIWVGLMVGGEGFEPPTYSV